MAHPVSVLTAFGSAMKSREKGTSSALVEQHSRPRGVRIDGLEQSALRAQPAHKQLSGARRRLHAEEDRERAQRGAVRRAGAKAYSWKAPETTKADRRRSPMRGGAVTQRGEHGAVEEATHEQVPAARPEVGGRGGCGERIARMPPVACIRA